MTEINYFHIIGVAPLLGYIGYLGYQNQPIGQNLGLFLILLAIIIVIYHAYLIHQKTGGMGSENYQRLPLHKGLSLN